jgi:VanZ family protein
LRPLQGSGRWWSNGAVLKQRVLLFFGWGWAAAIVWLSLAPIQQPVAVEHGDKLEHFAAYGLLMSVFCLIYDQWRTRLAYAAGFIAMGIAIEILQGMTDYRTFDLIDMAANAAGVLLILAGALLLSRMPAR